MKFIHRHRAEILAVLHKFQIAEAEISFVKKRGRINIIHQASAASFSYLRKKETQLDPVDRQWKQGEWFKIKSNHDRERKVENWAQVMEAFEIWVASI